MSIASRLTAAGAAFIAVVLLSGGAVQPPALADTCHNAALRSGASERLPDCRAYERVSPVDTNGLDAVSPEPSQPAQSSACGPSEPCTIAYMNVGASFAGAPSNELANAYVSSRGGEGWQTTPLTPPTPQAPTDGTPRFMYAFSEDLSEAVLRVPSQQLAPNAVPGVYNLYLRGPAGGYSLVTAATPAKLPPPGCAACFEGEDVSEFAGASSDFSRILFEANDSLEGAPSGEFEGRPIENLYESVDEHVHVVGVLPDGDVAPDGASAGGGVEIAAERVGELQHAISDDGSRVVFEARADGGPPDPAQSGVPELYDRIDAATTVELSAPLPGARAGECETPEHDCEPAPARFWAAAADGSVVYFTSAAALTRQSYVGGRGNPKGSSLYRYDLETNTLTNVVTSADEAAGQASAGVLGVVGASEDGSYVYFVSEGKLTETATSGVPNLYVWHDAGGGTPTIAFIATLEAPTAKEEEHIEDQDEGNGVRFDSDVADWTRKPTESQAYVTPDGRHLAFMSVEPLTGYDNEDAHTGERDHEVFEYDAETGVLVCVSCDPSGARPLGSAFLGAELTERASTPFHQPRSLSDDGSRLFFSSPDPLAEGLPGGTDKLFEYEDGAPQLISGSEAGARAVFLDASPSGDDVFFASREQLTPTETNEVMTVYDARVDGGLPPPSSQPSCPDESCLSEAAPPPFFSAPLSASFVGSGNSSPAPSARPSRQQRLARALAQCRRFRTRKRRESCAAAARRRFGAKARRPERVAHSRGSAGR